MATTPQGTRHPTSQLQRRTQKLEDIPLNRKHHLHVDCVVITPPRIGPLPYDQLHSATQWDDGVLTEGRNR
jgi:hypothetical protein